MSELSERVAREHRVDYITWVGDAEIEMVVCTCGARTEEPHRKHLADVTEAAVRETIAADIEAVRIGIDNSAHPADRAARIARGET